jgi:hypothetical protein
MGAVLVYNERAELESFVFDAMAKAGFMLSAVVIAAGSLWSGYALLKLSGY